MKIRKILERAAVTLGLDIADEQTWALLVRCAYLSSAFLASRFTKKAMSEIPVIKTGDELFSFEFSPAVLEFGIMAEYAFINGMFNEAQVWTEKMREILFNETSRVKVMPPSWR